MELSKKSEMEILAVVNPIMDNLMAGSTEIDHAKHTRDFTDRLKAIVTPEYLQNVCSCYQAEWGFFTNREFVAVFRRSSSVAVIWKQWCTKQSGEFVAELVLVEQNKQYLVDHVMVF